MDEVSSDRVISESDTNVICLRVNMELNDKVKVENVIGMTVTDILGLTVTQAKVISLIGTFLGPSLTLPGIAGFMMQWRKRKKRASVRRKTA